MATQELELPVPPTQLVSRCAGEPFVCALDGGDVRSWAVGRALLGFRPRATLRVSATGAAVMRDGREQQWHGHPFELLDRFCAATAARARSAEPFAGGVVAALSYDLRHWVERLPACVRDDRGRDLPVIHAAAYDWLLSYSYADHRYQLASAHLSATELREVAAHIAALAVRPLPRGAGRQPPRASADVSEATYLAAVRSILEYIAAGDVYQVNLAHRFSVADPPAPAALFVTLQHQHPMPFAAYIDGGEFTLVSNSPECFLTLDGDSLATFPIKGTRPRATDAHSDHAVAAELQADPKERAEHVMIVDLERSDLGRVCRFGTVRVDEFARVHSFPSLHHLVSKVSGRLRPGTRLADVLRAMFPGGSISGAPKIRAMEIIDELEPVCRSFYTGAIGFIGFDGRAVFNLAIRTAVATPRRFTYHAGGGIVADSIPAREYDETLLKARAFFAALTATV